MQNLSMCRICLATDVRLCSVARSLQDMYEKLTELTFKREDRRPLTACYICLARLQNCYRLRMSCLRSDKLITKMMSSGVLVPQDMPMRNTLRVVPVLNLSLGHVLPNRIEGHIKEEAPEVIHDAELDQQNTEDIAIKPEEEHDTQMDEDMLCSHLDDPLDVMKREPDDVETDAEDLKFEIEDTVLEENDQNGANLFSQSADNTYPKIKKFKRSLKDPRTDIPVFKKLKNIDSQLDTDPEDYIFNKNNTDNVKAHCSHMPLPAFSRYSECVSGHSKPLASSEAFQRTPRIPGDDGVEFALNYGSEASSGESDDEEEMAVPLLPRSLRSVLDTPVDEEDCDDDDSAAAEFTEAEVTGTELPGSFLDFNWEEFPRAPIPPESRRESFSQNKVGPTTPCVDPYDIFTAIWDRPIMEHIALETNKYAQQVAAQLFESNNLHPNSRITRWKDTTVDELYVYFGVIMAMGIVVKSRLEEYWNSTADIFITPGFTAHISYNRFTLLTKCLHFNDNNEMSALNLDVSEAKLFKIIPILTHLNSKFQDMYKLSQNISLDESLLMWKGWLDIHQLVPNKAPVMGIKTYELCESQTGYLWRFEIHSHKKSPPQKPEDILNASTPALVLRLLHGLENMGHTVWMDSFYNSPALARRLKYLGFDCAGTLRTNRKFVPQALHDLTKDNMRPGELSGLTSGDVDVMVWKNSNSNRVAMISTYHGNNVSHYEGSTKPISILDYNIMMGGVDKKDQMLTLYPIERQRMSVWYKKLFRRLLNVSILNSFIIHKHSSSPSFPLTHRNFRISLVKALFSNHCIRTPSIPSVLPLPAPRAQNTQNVHVDVTHRVAQYQLDGKQRLRRKCTVCRKRVSSFCVGCQKPVCIEPCFVALHTT